MCALALAACILQPISAASKTLPSRFEGDRVFIVTRSHGERLTIYTDSGGGFLLSESAAKRLHLRLQTARDPQLLAAFGGKVMLAKFPPLAGNVPMPPEQTVPVVSSTAEIPGWPQQGDGIFGEAWFAGRTWTWNFSARTFSLDDESWKPPPGARRVPLTFKKNASGHRKNNFPRILIRIDGASVPMLLDTGAETYLTKFARARLRDGGPAMRATSMIAASIFDRWHARHPGWRIIHDAQIATHAEMIEVPRVELAGYSVGPVWFTRRPDANYRTFMSPMMAAPVEGSLGNNALRFFRVTIDYPRATAWLSLGVR